MWYVEDQEKISELNEAVNQQWYFVRHLETLSRWKDNGSTSNDIVMLRENLEQISELLAESIIWEQLA